MDDPDRFKEETVMRLHYKGKYDLDPESLPHGIHQPGAVPFREVQDSKSLALIANALAIVIFIPLGILLYMRIDGAIFSPQFAFGAIFSLLLLFPHEFLHAVCFREDVYLYTNFKQGLIFVVGPETMSKGRFVMMSMLPNIVFGFIPYGIAMLYPSFIFAGAFGLISIAIGAGDYYNVYHAVTQMPKGARTYLYKFNSFWYIPSRGGE